MKTTTLLLAAALLAVAAAPIATADIPTPDGPQGCPPPEEGYPCDPVPWNPYQEAKEYVGELGACAKDAVDCITT